MFAIIYGAVLFGAVCLVFGVVYPLGALIAYPVYRRLGGRMSLKEYMSNL